MPHVDHIFPSLPAVLNGGTLLQRSTVHTLPLPLEPNRLTVVNASVPSFGFLVRHDPVQGTRSGRQKNDRQCQSPVLAFWYGNDPVQGTRSSNHLFLIIISYLHSTPISFGFLVRHDPVQGTRSGRQKNDRQSMPNGYHFQGYQQARKLPKKMTVRSETENNDLVLPSTPITLTT